MKLDIEAVGPLVGKPWQFKANGPHAYDCWSVTVEGAARLFGIALPDITANLIRLADTGDTARDALATGQWERCEPQAGAVLCLVDGYGRVFHVGLMLSDHDVLTASRELGTHVAPLHTMIGACEAYQWRP